MSMRNHTIILSGLDQEAVKNAGAFVLFGKRNAIQGNYNYNLLYFGVSEDPLKADLFGSLEDLVVPIFSGANTLEEAKIRALQAYQGGRLTVPHLAVSNNGHIQVYDVKAQKGATTLSFHEVYTMPDEKFEGFLSGEPYAHIQERMRKVKERYAAFSA